MPTVFRVCRTDSKLYAAVTAAGDSLYAHYDALSRTLSAALPETTARLFARPVPTAGGAAVDWTTELNGQPTPLSALSPEDRGKAQALLAERLLSVRALADRTGDAVVADVLRRAAVPPGLDQVWVIGGQPLIVGWGHRGEGALPPPPVVPPPPIPARRSWWRWLLWLLPLLLLLGLAAFLLQRCGGVDIPGLPAVTGAFAPGGAAPPAAEPAGNEEDLSDLKARIAAAEAELRRRLDACATAAPEAPAATAPAPEAPAPQAVPAPKAEKPKPEKPAAVPAKPEKPKPDKRPSAAVPPRTPEPGPAEPAAKPPARDAACPQERPQWKRPEVMLMLDGSGSMALPSSMSDDEVRSLIHQAMRGSPAALARLNRASSGDAGSRLATAKRAIHDVVSQMPGDVDIGLLVFGKCEGTDNFKFFSPSQRGNLLSRVDGIRPERGTPLARGLERSGNMLDGVEVPGIIVVITDGMDSCDGDPCAAARALKSRKPNIKINVIGVVGSQSGRCMAEATGGRFLSPGKGRSWAEILMDATEQSAVPQGCRGAQGMTGR